MYLLSVYTFRIFLLAIVVRTTHTACLRPLYISLNLGHLLRELRKPKYLYNSGLPQVLFSSHQLSRIIESVVKYNGAVRKDVVETCLVNLFCYLHILSYNIKINFKFTKKNFTYFLIKKCCLQRQIAPVYTGEIYIDIDIRRATVRQLELGFVIPWITS